MRPSFDLTDQPWGPVVDEFGATRNLGPRELPTSADRLADLALSVPPAVAGAGRAHRPVSFAPTRRHSTTRWVWVATGQLPAALCAGYRATQLAALAAFRDRHHQGDPAWPSG